MEIRKEKLVHSENFIIRTYEIGKDKKVTIPALVKLMHEAAMQNVIQLGLSIWDLEPHYISWVLMRKLITIKRLPGLGEVIKIVTHPAGFEKFFTYRDYKVFDSSNECIAFSSSTWLLMDTKKRRMCRIPDFILEYSKWLPDASQCLPRPKNKLPKLEIAAQNKDFKVTWHDLDFNRHLNNTYYVQWMLEALPDDILQAGGLREIDIIYRKECHWKDIVRSEIQQLDERTFLHRLLRKGDGKELALGQTSWEL